MCYNTSTLPHPGTLEDVGYRHHAMVHSLTALTLSSFNLGHFEAASQSPWLAAIDVQRAGTVQHDTGTSQAQPAVPPGPCLYGPRAWPSAQARHYCEVLSCDSKLSWSFRLSDPKLWPRKDSYVKIHIRTSIRLPDWEFVQEKVRINKLLSEFQFGPPKFRFVYENHTYE